MQIQTENINWKKLNREERGKIIFQNLKIKKTPSGWRVPSQSNKSRGYLVRYRNHKPKCTCPDCEIRRKKCGIVVNYKKEDVGKAIMELMKDEEKLRIYRENAIKYAGQFDWDRIFTKTFGESLCIF